MFQTLNQRETTFINFLLVLNAIVEYFKLLNILNNKIVFYNKYNKLF